ncbi:DUF3048 domain-containing protein [Feifania hominis]|uniref:DUF3048 domain-containing protein n=1 Tax=Feifania hominis TaxID=2763660 RepID=A0A926DH87_9FIRM|nr:DUF3048 domain-containing protein [Feifania hominis]MBC8537030.1 DUF3048 domain-containing protein [Feifania hominis]
MKRTVALLLSVLLLLALGACKSPSSEPVPPVTGGEEDLPPAVDPQPEPEPVPEPESEPVVRYWNPLTGQPMPDSYEMTRPVAVMINNLKPALPQNGIGSADGWFEFPAEGETNRIMAVFYNYQDIEQIGTVRSARDYFLDYARPLDAIFLHYGGSPQAYKALKRGDLDAFDGINGDVEKSLYWRDKDRIKNAAWEHSVMTSGEKITATIEKFKKRAVLEQELKPLYTFRETPAPAGEQRAEFVKIPFSNYIAPSYEYNADTGLYERYQYGKKHIDGLTGEQIAVENVIILQTSVKAIPGDDASRVTVATTGSGKGYYCSRGTVCEIRWEKKSDSSFVKLMDAQGKELAINPGRSFVSILSDRKKITLE